MVEDENVSVVERDGLDSYEGLLWAWFWEGSEVVEDEMTWGGDLPGAVGHV